MLNFRTGDPRYSFYKGVLMTNNNDKLIPWNISDSLNIPEKFCGDIYDISNIFHTPSWAICSIIKGNFDDNMIEPIYVESMFDKHFYSLGYEQDRCSQIRLSFIELFLAVCKEGFIIEEEEETPDYVGAIEDFGFE